MTEIDEALGRIEAGLEFLRANLSRISTDQEIDHVFRTGEGLSEVELSAWEQANEVRLLPQPSSLR